MRLSRGEVLSKEKEARADVSIPTMRVLCTRGLGIRNDEPVHQVSQKLAVRVCAAAGWQGGTVGTDAETRLKAALVLLSEHPISHDRRGTYNQEGPSSLVRQSHD